jgi:hypothetical protein
MLHLLECKAGEIGVTVRKGPKWADSIGQEILLCVCDGEGNHDIQGKGIVLDAWMGQFKNVPARWLEKEHEKMSRVYSGLLTSMRRAYGPEFNEEEEVTALMYNRIE